MLHSHTSLAATISAAAIVLSPSARAQDAAAMAARMDAMQSQMQAMQHELAALRRQAGMQRASLAGETRERRILSRDQARLVARSEHRQQAARSGGPGGVPPAAEHTPAILANDLACNAGSYALGPAVCFTPGGFVELAGIFRNSNLVSDVATDFNGIPFRNNPRSRESEFRFSARQSRLSGLFIAKVDPTLQVSGYYELDFLAAGTTSNSRETNSYVPRIRQVFASLDSLDTGWHVLAGQAWSLLTTNLSGITPVKEQVPLTIDAQFVPGFNWTRSPQIRVVKDIVPGVWAGLSVEAPQSVLPPSPFVAPSNVNVSNTGDPAGLLNSATTYSNNSVPDLIGKVVVEPGFGHYELKGLVRHFEDRVSPTAATGPSGHTGTATGFGIGGAATLPVIDKVLDLQVSGLVGRGIGRYGTSLLPDFALKTGGGIAPVPAFQLLAGAVGHIQPGTDIYVYAGWEHAGRAGASSAIGYGAPTLVTAGCDVEGSASATCEAESRDIRQVTGGFWHDLYKGGYGRLVAGAQISYTERDAFHGALGIQPSTHLVTGLTSLRYYPF